MKKIKEFKLLQNEQPHKNDCHKKKKTEKESSDNITEEINSWWNIHCKMFKLKISGPSDVWLYLVDENLFILNQIYGW